MLGGLSSELSDMATLKDLEKVGLQFINSFSDFLDDAVFGPDLRVEAVVSSRIPSDVFAVVPDYGARLVQFCLESGIVFKTTKNWSYYVNERVTSALKRLSGIVKMAESISFNRDVSIFFFTLFVIVIF